MKERGATPSFSRTGVTSPFGKLDEVVKFRESGIVVDAFRKKCAAMGKPDGEILRIAYRLIALGPDTVKKLQAVPIEQVEQMLSGMLHSSQH